MINWVYIAFTTIPYIVLIMLYKKLSKQMGDIDRWVRVNGEVVKQEERLSNGKRFWYNTYQFISRNKEYTIGSEIGTKPKSGKIGEKRNLLFNDDKIVLPDNWIVRNYRLIGYSLLFAYWPFWVIVYFNSFRQPN